MLRLSFIVTVSGDPTSPRVVIEKETPPAVGMLRNPAAVTLERRGGKKRISKGLLTLTRRELARKATASGSEKKGK